MFLGRDTYAAKIKDSLVGTIYKHDSNVNQAVKRLLKHGSEFLIFQRRYREEGTPGREAEIYTASFDPVFLTLKAFDIDFNEKELQDALESLSTANNSFPQYLINTFDTSILRKSAWHLTLANYFHFVSELMLRASLDPQITSQMEQTYSISPINIPIPKEKVNSLLSKHPDLAKKFRSTALRISLPKAGLNSALCRALIENLPNIDKNFFRMISALSELESFLRMLASKNIESLIDYIEKVRETEEFLNWKSEKDKKKES